MQGQFEPCACERTDRPPQLAHLTANKRVSSRVRLQTAAKRGPADSAAVKDRRSRKRNKQPRPRRRMVKAGKLGDTTPGPSRRQLRRQQRLERRNRTRTGRGRLRQFSKQLKPTRIDTSLPANGRLFTRFLPTLSH